MTNAAPRSERDALRIEVGISTAELARRANISVDTVRTILSGREGQATKVKAVDDALARAAQEKGVSASIGHDGGSEHHLAEEGLMEFEVGGNFGVSVVVRGPVANREDLESSVMRLIQGMNAGAGKPSD